MANIPFKKQRYNSDTHEIWVEDPLNPQRGGTWAPRSNFLAVPDYVFADLPFDTSINQEPLEIPKIVRSQIPSELYMIGSLRNEEIPRLANYFENHTGVKIFDSWFAAGPLADDSWRDYETVRMRKYKDALKGYAARHVFEFDRFHLDRCDGGILVLPSGKSGHLEAGYLCGQDKPVWVFMPTKDMPERWDVMYQFCSGGVFHTEESLAASIREYYG